MAAGPAAVRVGRGPRGVRDPKHPFAQMGQSKQEGVKLSVALIYIKASVFKNRSKIPLPSPLQSLPALFLCLGCPLGVFGSRGPVARVGARCSSAKWSDRAGG